MRRRELLGLVAGAITWPLAARAQQTKLPIVGMLGGGFAVSSTILIDAFKKGMVENDLEEGRDYVLDLRWAEGDYARFPALAAELVRGHSSVILVSTIAAARAAQRAAPTAAIIMTGLIDPVGTGLVTSLARPGGNTTGLANLAQDVTGKGLELLHTAVPGARKIATLFNPTNPANLLIMEQLPAQAGLLDLTIDPIEFKGPVALDATIKAAMSGRPDALLVVGDAALVDLREQIASLALRYKLPMVSSIPELTDAGGLIGYGTPRRDFYRRAATYVKKVLGGAKPADLPVEQPTLIELSINVRTARALGIAIPESVLSRADRVID